MTPSLVSLNLRNDPLVAVHAPLSALESNLSGRVSLSPDRRRSVPHMGDKSEAFCRQTLSLLGQIDQSQPRTRVLKPKWIVREDVSGARTGPTSRSQGVAQVHFSPRKNEPLDIPASCQSSAPG